MVERAKKRLMPMLLTLMIAALLAVSGFAIVGVNSASVNAENAVTGSAKDDGDITEDVDTGYDDGLNDNNDYTEDVNTSSSVLYNYTTSGQRTVTLGPGKYRFECWGAQGGKAGSGTAGAGGYAKGELTLTASTTLYIYVGGCPGTNNGNAGYNGGGSAVYDGAHGTGSYAAGGGGASDIRVGGTALLNRMLVAGGGGGGGSFSRSGSVVGTGAGGAGGTSSGANGTAGTKSFNDNGTGGNGGTQTAGGTYTGSGSYGKPGAFGVGGTNSCSSSPAGWNGSGGGGGWYGGASGGALGGGGGGGSSYAATSSSTKPSGYAVSSTYYLINTSGTGSKTGAGRVKITALNSPPAQSSIPTITLNRNMPSSVAYNSLNVTSSLNVTDPDNDTVKIRTQGIYMGAGTNYAKADAISGGNYWLEYTCNADATSFTVRARRYWSGTKRFYINLKDYSTVNVCSGNVWVAFDAKVTVGGTSVGAGPTNIGAAGTKFRYGMSNNTTNPTTASTTYYNPLGANRRTLWLDDALSSAKDTIIDVGSLFTHTAGNNNNASSQEALVFSPTVTYGTNRYAKDSTNATAQPITGNPANSSYFTQVTNKTAVTGTQYTGSAVNQNYTLGYSSLALRAKTNVPAGAYYYVMTVKAMLVDKLSAVTIWSQDIDIVYRVDNSRPVITDPTAARTLTTGGASVTIPVSEICTDPDKNTLTIADVIVPEHEFVMVDQYGNLQTGSGVPYTNLNKYYNRGKLDKYDMNSATVKSTAQTDTETGFIPNFVYKTSGSGANNGFASSQTQGNSSTAYVGYYINSANNAITLVGNKATRNMYKSGRGDSLGHFYIMVRIVDSGNTDDLGIWFPIAVEVRSAAPKAAGFPQVKGNAGDEFYFTPLGVQQSDGSYYGIGAYLGSNQSLDSAFANDVFTVGGKQENDSSKKVVQPFAYDSDNYADGTAGLTRTSTITDLGKMTINDGRPATYSQRETVFVMPNTDKLGNNLHNYYLFNGNGYNTQGTAAADERDGFKEFFEVSRVELYAKSSILIGLTDDEIKQYVADGVLSFVTCGGDKLVKYSGIKIKLKKYTGGKYVSFYVHVRDSHGTESNLRISVNVNNTEITASNARSDIDPAKNNYNTRPDENGEKTTQRLTSGDGASVVFRYDMRVGETVTVSPYDLFYDSDTYAVNHNVNKDIKVYNTVVGSEGHSEMMKGINKVINVYSADSPETEFGTVGELPSRHNTLALKNLSIGNTKPQIFGGDIYIDREYIPENTGSGAEASEHFLITARRKTPATGYVSFNYVVTTSAGGTVTAEIRVYVRNSLPNIRPELNEPYEYEDADKNKVTTYKMPFKLTASTDIERVNSSDFTNGEVTGVDDFLHEYFLINGFTYNIREFTLDDLFYDPDGDIVQFYDISAGIQVGIHDNDGNFIEFGGDTPNVYVNAYIGAGTNSRAGISNCLILQGLSGTQGLPGGLWIRFQIIDNAVGSFDAKWVEFQVEVFNSTPKYADMTGVNAMDNLTTDPNALPRYSWTEESEETTCIVANIFNGNDISVDNPQPEEPTHDNNGNPVRAQATSVNKAMYIASNDKVMEYYKKTINDAIDAYNTAHSAHLESFSYAPSQVRKLAQDVDGGQGLALWGAGYSGAANKAPGFNIHTSFPTDDKDITFTGEDQTENAAVLITPIYRTEQKLDYYKDNNVVQLMFFDAEGNRITDAQAANEAVNWVIAFNFTTTPGQFNVRVRLRDSNAEIALPGDNTGTAGGFSNVNNQNRNVLYEGTRTPVVDESGNRTGYAPNAYNAELYRGNGFFGVRMGKRPRGLYNNFTKWSSTATFSGSKKGQEPDKTNAHYGESLNNVWTQGEYTYFDAADGVVNQNGFFRYDGISVPHDETGVGVPISYFAWPAESSDTSKRTSQAAFAWYDIDTFGKLLNNTSTEDFKAITLSDGYNSWSGADLNRNPYVIFQARRGLTNENLNQSGHPFGNQNGKSVYRNYLHGQQRFTMLGTTPRLIPVVDTSTEALKGHYFFEDQFGLIIKKGTVRSVGNLTLTVRLALWTQEENGDYVRTPDSAITVTVPLSVDNAPLRVNNASGMPAREYKPDSTSASAGDINIALSTNVSKDTSTLGGAFVISSDDTDDQYNSRINGMTGDLLNPAGIVYRENMYFLANSFNGAYSNSLPAYEGGAEPVAAPTSFSEQELVYIKEQAAKNSDLAGRLATYFGISAADIQNLAIRDNHLVVLKSEGGNYVVDTDKKVNINPYFLNYFTVSPSGADSQRISISPTRITTFDFSGLTTQSAIRKAAEKRNLKVEFKSTGESSVEISRIYYPLRVIVYDRMTVGYVANTTTFTNSSFDVVTIQVEIVNSKPTLNSLYNSVYGTGTTKNAREISLVKGRYVEYNFTDIFYDSDMVYDQSTGTYKTKAAILGNSQESLDRDTGDYLQQATDSDGNPLFIDKDKTIPQLVGIKFMNLAGATGVTNQYTEDNLKGAVECAATSTGIHIEIKNSASVREVGTGIVAWIQLTFRDKYMTNDTLTCYIGVRISNAAPTLSSNATNVRNITMHTGQYFTLYTTPYSEFIEGAYVSNTVGTPMDSQVLDAEGSYYSTLRGSKADSTSSNLRAPYQPWTFNGGPVGYNTSQVYKMPNLRIGIDEYEPGDKAYENNLGYMAITSDDAPWTLRIGNYSIKAPGVNDYRDVLVPRLLNIVPYETNQEETAATAIMFTAIGAVQNATVEITVLDGVNLAGESTLSVTYTFNITVESTAPTAITSSSEISNPTYKLGDSLIGTADEYILTQKRLSHEQGAQEPTESTYNLRLNVGESVTLKTNDFAHDIDRGDDSILPLLPRSGNNPFTIKDMDYPTGDVAESSRYISLTHSNGNNPLTDSSIQFTVTATNFHNGSGDKDLYSAVDFYIGDPYNADVNHAVHVILRVYVYPSGVEKVSNTKDIDITGVTASSGAQTVKLVTKTTADGGLFTDKDAEASNTLYSVKVYTLTHYKVDDGGAFVTENGNKIIESYAMSDFTPDDRLLVAEFRVTETAGNNNTYTVNTQAFAFESNYLHADIIRNFIGEITFSEDGKEMYLAPARATNGFRQVVGDNYRNGFRLCIAVEKFVKRSGGQGVGSTPDGSKAPEYSASTFASVSVLNSAPRAVGNTENNIGRHIASNPDTVDNYRAYLSVEGRRGDEWIYPVYNTISEYDEALFADPDDDPLSYVDYNLKRVYTYEYTDTDEGTVSRQVDVEDPAVLSAAKSAFSVRSIPDYNFQIKSGNTVVKEATLPAVKLAILNKIVIQGAADRTVYLEIEISGKDAYSSERAYTTITLGIANSTPVFKSVEEIAEKYKDSKRGTSYEKDEYATDAELTLTLNVDNDKDRFISNNGEVTVPVSDLVKDNDYTGITGIERFEFVNAGLSNIADMSMTNGIIPNTIWLHGDDYAAVADSSQYKNKNFLVSIDANSNIVFKVNTYNRGASSRLVLKVKDTAGETTGVLTITLIIGNSAPIDMVSTGEVNGRIVLAGGKVGDINDGKSFTPTQFSLLDFVRDNNPDDMRDMTEEPTSPTTYLRITNYDLEAPIFEFGDGGDSGDNGNGGGGGVGGDDIIQEKQLVNFVTSFGQSFSIAPIPGAYGRQTINITVSDGGNSNRADSMTAVIELRIQVTPNPNDLDVYDYHVYWKRTSPVTARDIFDDPGTFDLDESEGIIIKSVAVQNNPRNTVEISKPNDSEYWMVTGNVKTEEGAPIKATAKVIVGNKIEEGATEYEIKFNIVVDDNKAPDFRVYGTSGEKYGDGITYIQKGYLTSSGIWEVSVNDIFVDGEGDELKLISAESKKSTLIDVVADTQNNKFIFQFKSRGDTEITCQVKDAVSTYTYYFKIGNADLPAPNFFIGIIAQIQENPLIFIIIAAAVLVLLIILIAIIAAVRKKKKMRAEIEALLISEMELEEQMLKLAAGPSPTSYQAYGYLPPNPNMQQQPGLMLGEGQGAPNPNAAIGLNPGQNPAQKAQNQQLPPENGGFSDDDL